MISIILPAYNAEKTIHRCVDSIIAQQYQDWELIAVNDGSIDNTSSIILEYSKIDHRVKLMDKQNGGVGSARNTGLASARGELITFVDSDDWVKPDYLLTLMKGIGEYDFLMSYPIKIINGEEYSSNRKCVCCGSDSFSLLFTDGEIHFNTSPWAKLYRRRIIESHGLSFNTEMRIGEDALFLFQYLSLCSNAVAIDYSGYCYQYDSNASLTKGVYPINVERVSYLSIYDVLSRFIHEKNITDSRALSSIAWIKGYYSRRMLNAIYHDDSLSSRLRIKMVLGIDYMKYVDYLHTDSIKESFLKLLLSNDLLRCYDMVRVLASKMR